MSKLNGTWRGRVLASLGVICALSAFEAGWPAHAQLSKQTAEDPKKEGVIVRSPSFTRRLVSEDTLEQQAAMQYRSLLQGAQQKGALLPQGDPHTQRLAAIAQKIFPHTKKWSDRTEQWKWEVNVIASPQLNAFCMPGGKIAFFQGIIDKLQLSDDEIAIVMGHEMTHALREHARARQAKATLTAGGAFIIARLLGLGQIGDIAANQGAQLLILKFSRGDETEADLIGMELAARAGYDPRAGIALWQKMGAAAQGAPPQWLSTHPANGTRIADMKKQMERVLPLYARATGQDPKAIPPYRSNLPQIRQGLISGDR